MLENTDNTTTQHNARDLQTTTQQQHNARSLQTTTQQVAEQ
jgi:hypothetical protein